MSSELVAVIVFTGAFAQAATGVGFGVVAGPFLLQAHGYERAIGETAVFSLLVALVSAAGLAREAERRATALLTATLPAGVALGAAIAFALPQAVVVALFGFVLAGLGMALLQAEIVPAGAAPPSGRPAAPGRIVASAGIVAGAGAYLFAAPGPAAAWGLARARLNPQAARGTLAVYFVFAYAAIIGAFGLAGSLGRLDWAGLAAMSPACLGGSLTGALCGGRLSARALRVAIGSIVAASGLNLLASTIWRAS